MQKRVRVKFLNDKLEQEYISIPENDKLKKRINWIIEQIRIKPSFGQPIAKRLIPREYIKQGIISAYWVELSKKGGRLIYSLTSENKEEITAIIVEWFSRHKDYGRRFGYE